MVKAEIARILERALDRCAKDGLLPAERPPVQLDAPKNPAHGDFACNAAMMLQKQHAQATGAAKPNPRALAQAIVERIEDPDGALEKVEIAGPGFLNLRVAKRLFFLELGAVFQEKERFGH
ncbi:MAG: arginine--tRNA ligase, partial [Myxococcales bacterium]